MAIQINRRVKVPLKKSAPVKPVDDEPPAPVGYNKEVSAPPEPVKADTASKWGTDVFTMTVYENDSVKMVARVVRNGKDSFDLRTYWRPDANSAWMPTKKGARIDMAQFSAVVKAIKEKGFTV